MTYDCPRERRAPRAGSGRGEQHAVLRPHAAGHQGCTTTPEPRAKWTSSSPRPRRQGLGAQHATETISSGALRAVSPSACAVACTARRRRAGGGGELPFASSATPRSATGRRPLVDFGDGATSGVEPRQPTPLRDVRLDIRCERRTVTCVSGRVVVSRRFPSPLGRPAVVGVPRGKERGGVPHGREDPEPGLGGITVTPTFYDQASGASCAGRSDRSRSQAAFDNVSPPSREDARPGRVRPDPVRRDGPIVVLLEREHVNACGSRRISGQWLPASTRPGAEGGTIPQVAVSSDASTGYRTNLVVVNPSGRGDGDREGAQGRRDAPLRPDDRPPPPNGFRQVALDDRGFPRRDRNERLEPLGRALEDRPVLAFASVIHNAPRPVRGVAVPHA